MTLCPRFSPRGSEKIRRQLWLHARGVRVGDGRELRGGGRRGRAGRGGRRDDRWRRGRLWWGRQPPSGKGGKTGLTGLGRTRAGLFGRSQVGRQKVNVPELFMATDLRGRESTSEWWGCLDWQTAAQTAAVRHTHTHTNTCWTHPGVSVLAYDVSCCLRRRWSSPATSLDPSLFTTC